MGGVWAVLLVEKQPASDVEADKNGVGESTGRIDTVS